MQANPGSPDPDLEQLLPMGPTGLAHCLQSNQQYLQLDGGQCLVVLEAWDEGYHQVTHLPLQHGVHQVPPNSSHTLVQSRTNL
jgi:hypothetical protein